ncbi:MAG TPA: GGDEF domain-containing protein [Thermoanaerobaculia bacterium]|nr:GGDEF domain-containing protein [Thermoanaerobaculia bacterium]
MRENFRLRELWAESWAPPDSETREYGREGELLTARVRIAALCVLVLIPFKSILVDPHDTDNWIGLGVAGAALLLGAAVLSLARRPVPPRWLGLFSSILDVTLVSAGNVGFLLAGHPLTATNSQVQYSIYFLALAGTCLRHDTRLCLAAGAAALLEYGAVVLWSVTHWDLAGPAFARDPYGAFNWDSQVGRLLLLALAAAISAVIVSRAGRYWRDSIHDRLTGLPNRRYAEERLNQAVEVARRTRRPLVLALADLDHFKQVNDRHGHAAGDAALVHAASALRQFFRRTDLIARYGGEEFLLLFPDADAVSATERLELFRVSFAAEPHRLSGSALPLTLSVGLAVFPTDGESPDELLARADHRLYAAKQAGRDRIHGP